jgi:hypothetical protein
MEVVSQRPYRPIDVNMPVAYTTAVKVDESAETPVVEYYIRQTAIAVDQCVVLQQAGVLGDIALCFVNVVITYISGEVKSAFVSLTVESNVSKIPS